MRKLIIVLYYITRSQGRDEIHRGRTFTRELRDTESNDDVRAMVPDHVKKCRDILRAELDFKSRLDFKITNQFKAYIQERIA